MSNEREICKEQLSRLKLSISDKIATLALLKTNRRLITVNKTSLPEQMRPFQLTEMSRGKRNRKSKGSNSSPVSKTSFNTWFSKPTNDVTDVKENRALFCTRINDYRFVNNVTVYTVLSSRYVLVAVQADFCPLLTVYDLFHNEKQVIKLDKVRFSMANLKQLEVIDANRILATAVHYTKGAKSVYLHLIGLNFKEKTSQLFDEKEINDDSLDLLVEVRKRKKFLLYDKTKKTLQMGRVGYIDLTLDEIDIDMEFKEHIDYYRLVDNTLYGISDSLTLREFELDFESGSIKQKPSSFSLNSGNESDVSDNWGCCLFADKMYICKDSHGPNNIYCIDVQERTIQKIVQCRIGHIFDMQLDEDNILSVCVKDSNNKTMFLRLPLRSPETLLKTCFFEAKIKLKPSKFKSIINKIPQNLQPFCFDC